MSQRSNVAPDPAENQVTVPSSRKLYSYEARREGRVIAKIAAFGASDGSVVVETKVHPVNQPLGDNGIARPFEFPDADYARRFVDEALLALEYLNCDIVD
ncbi:MAG: hypothetical protein H0U46_05020 [Actinobacteria bacterium]|nr:hypothetical protein [Actinomycetota bacterium]